MHPSKAIQAPVTDAINTQSLTDFSDTVVFVDESGDANLKRIDPQFPVLNLVFIIIRKDHYFDRVVGGLSQLKTQFFGTDDLVMHEADLRRQRGAFRLLKAPHTRLDCQRAISDWIRGLEFQIISACIDKEALARRYRHPFDPYDLAIRFCLERTLAGIRPHTPPGRITQICFESRGRAQDRVTGTEFDAVIQAQSILGHSPTQFAEHPMQALFIPKYANVAGLQLADLIARPLARHCLNRQSQQPVMAVLRPKLYAHKIFPDTGRLNQFFAGKTRSKPAAKDSQAP